MNKEESTPYTRHSLKWTGKPFDNFAGWRKGLATVMTRAYGQPAMFFRHFIYDAPPKFATDVIEAVTGEADLAKRHYLNELNRHMELLSYQRLSHIQMYSAVFDMLHPDTVKQLERGEDYATMHSTHDPLTLIEELSKIMLVCSTGNVRQDRFKSRMGYNSISQREKETIHDYYERTAKAIATQTSVGQKPSPDEDQAMDFIYKLDQRIFKDFIVGLNMAEQDQMRIHATIIKTKPRVEFKSTYPNSLDEAYQRVKSYSTCQVAATTGTVWPQQTVFASDSSDQHAKDNTKSTSTSIPREEWIKMTKEQQDAVKAKNKKSKTKICNYCSKAGHIEPDCRALKHDIAELKKFKSQHTVAQITHTANTEEDEDSQEEMVYVHTTENS